MGKVANRLSLIRRSNNRTTARPPSPQHSLAVGPSTSDIDEYEKKGCGVGARDGKLFVLPSHRDSDWRVSSATVYKLLFSIRTAAAFWAIISDCDEVYNYWEPLHLLLFGRGFQTWEYSPVYAIRSWLYVYVHFIPAQLLFPLLAAYKVAFFHAIRFAIGLFCLTGEVCLYESASERLGNKIGSLFILFSMFGVGMFNASCAFLPSSFSMTMNCFAMAAYLKQKWLLAIACTAISALVGWPFAAILGLPIIMEMMIRGRALALRFCLNSLAVGIVTLALLYLVDSYFYGKTVIAPLNIVLYNVFSKQGPDLYGVEPASFYVKNLLLNCNVLVPYAGVSLPLSLCAYVHTATGSNHKGAIKGTPRWKFDLAYWYRYVPVLLIYASAALWLLIFFTQPHKEERFLFPVFPLIALLAAICMDSLWQLSGKFNYPLLASIGIFLLLSLSRAYALHRNYGGVLEAYKGFHDHLVMRRDIDLSKTHDPIRLCVGKEWHRFYSSFFLPEAVMVGEGNGAVKKRVELDFLRSEFRGLLPRHFPVGDIPHITRQIPTDMNDMNREEMSRYVDPDSCDFIIDLDTGQETTLEPNYARKDANFTTLIERPFLLAGESHPLFRAYYVPLTSHLLIFGNIHVLRRR